LFSSYDLTELKGNSCLRCALIRRLRATFPRPGEGFTSVDLTGVPTMDQSFNPNGSVLAIEGITSPDGRVFGKMGHSERSGEYLYKNVTGDKYQPIFEGGVDYFKV